MKLKICIFYEKAFFIRENHLNIEALSKKELSSAMSNLSNLSAMPPSSTTNEIYSLQLDL